MKTTARRLSSEARSQLAMSGSRGSAHWEGDVERWEPPEATQGEPGWALPRHRAVPCVPAPLRRLAVVAAFLAFLFAGFPKPSYGASKPDDYDYVVELVRKYGERRLRPTYPFDELLQDVAVLYYDPTKPTPQTKKEIKRRIREILDNKVRSKVRTADDRVRMRARNKRRRGRADQAVGDFIDVYSDDLKELASDGSTPERSTVARQQTYQMSVSAEANGGLGKAEPRIVGEVGGMPEFHRMARSWWRPASRSTTGLIALAIVCGDVGGIVDAAVENYVAAFAWWPSDPHDGSQHDPVCPLLLCCGHM